MTLVLALLAAAAAPPPAGVVTPPAPAAALIDTAALAAARRVIAARDVNRQMRALLPQIVDAAMGQARATFKAGEAPEGLVSELEKTMREAMPGLMDVFTPDVQDKMAAAYARHFSAGDLNHLADLMNDPVMARFRDGQPAVMAEVMPALMAAMQPKQQAFQRRIMSTVIEWLQKHPGDRSRLAKPISS